MHGISIWRPNQLQPLIKEYPVFAINGCDGNCVEKILNERGVNQQEL